MKRTNLTQTASLLALAGVLSLAPVFAEDAPEPKSKKGNDGTTQRKEQVKGEQDKAIDSVHMHNCLEQLKLTDEQQMKVRDILAKYEAETDGVWSKFKHCYRDTIRTEVLLITAIEDNLTPEQQKQVRSQRRKLAHEAKINAKAAPKAKPVSDSKEIRDARNEGPAGDQPNEKDPAGAVGEATLDNINLTPEQEQMAEELHDKYFSRMRSLKREIDNLHTRLVALEADEMAEIETVLTEEQMTQLRESRKECPAPAKVADRNAQKSAR